MCLPASIMFCADVLYLRVFTHVHYAPHSCVSPQQYLPPDMCLTNYKLTDGRGITINVMQSRILWRIWKCNCCVMGSQNGKEIQKVGSEEMKMKSKKLELRNLWRKAIWTLAGRFGFYVQIILLPDFNHNYRAKD